MGVVLLTTNNFNLDGVEILDSFSKVKWEYCNCLIFHSTVDDDVIVTRELSSLSDKVEKVIYINKDINPLYYCIFTGLEADIYDTEDYLQDNSVLDYIVSEYRNTGMTIKSPNMHLETLTKGISSISTSDFDVLKKMVSNEFWVKTLSTAVSSVSTALARADKVSVDVLEMLKQTTAFIENIEKDRDSTTKELNKLRLLIEEMSSNNAQLQRRTNTPTYYAEIVVPRQVPKVLYIKAVSHCRYLNTFVLAYQHYLRMVKQYQAKVLFIVPHSKMYLRKIGYLMNKSGDVTRLDVDSIRAISLNNSIYVTFDPKPVILNTFFGIQSTDVYIVVDLMYGDNLIKGFQVETFHAVSGSTDIEIFKLNPNRVIAGVSRIEGSISIPPIKNYTLMNDNDRKNTYFKACGEGFKVIDSVLFRGG